MKTCIGAGFVFLWLRIGCVSGGENVKQSPSSLSVHQGAKAVINCTYSDGASEYFPWYKQERGKSLRLIIYIRSNKQREEDQKLTVLLDKNAKHLSLHIADTQPGDSAIYFCAASAQCFTRHLQPVLKPMFGAFPFWWCRSSFISFEVKANVLAVNY